VNWFTTQSKKESHIHALRVFRMPHYGDRNLWSCHDKQSDVSEPERSVTAGGMNDTDPSGEIYLATIDGVLQWVCDRVDAFRYTPTPDKQSES